MQIRFVALRSSLRTKVIIGVVLPLTVILSAFTVIEYRRQKKAVMDNLALLATHTGQVVENSLRHQMMQSDLEGLGAILESVTRSQEFKAVYLLDISGKVIFASADSSVGERLNKLDPACQDCHNLPSAARPGSVVVTDESGERVFRSMHPIENGPECSSCHDPEERLLGLLLTDISTAPFENPLTEDLLENILWWTLVTLFSILAVSFAVDRFVLRRLENMTAAIHSFGQGESLFPTPEKHPDEIGKIAIAFSSMTEQVEARNRENQELSDRLQRQSKQRGVLLKGLITAQENERQRVARELHDELGQVLAGLALRVEMLERSISKDHKKAFEYLNETRNLINNISNRMYDLIIALRPSALDDLGLVAALRAHAQRQLSETGIKFELDDSELTTRLPSEVETALYRVCQEALSNVVRHANASRVHVRLAQRNGTIEAGIWDDGQGFNLSSIHLDGDNGRGLGILGMQERITQCGGHFEISSRPGNGTQIQIRMVLDEANCG